MEKNGQYQAQGASRGVAANRQRVTRLGKLINFIGELIPFRFSATPNLAFQSADFPSRAAWLLRISISMTCDSSMFSLFNETSGDLYAMLRVAMSERQQTVLIACYASEDRARLRE